MLPWLLCAALAAAVLILCLRLWLLHRAMDELRAQLPDLLGEDTNVLLGISSRDKHARALAAALNRELRELRRLRWKYMSGDRELKEAVTNISHDLRTPLTAICGYLELLEREDKSEAAEKYLAYIGERAEAMRRLTEELFCYSVVLSPDSEPETGPGDLRAALERSLAGFYPALTERGITPEVALPDGPVICLLNEDDVSRVFGNVLSNALRYSAGDLSVRLTPEGAVEFENSAPGLDEVQVGRLFDRFFTVEAARGGTGLGLAIARMLMEQMGGYVSAELRGGRLCIRAVFARGG